MRVAESYQRGGAGRRIPPSMGPQHESCGKDNITMWIHPETTLQWGRNMRVAESVSANEPHNGAGILQWGRNMRVAESMQVEFLALVENALQWGRNMRVAESRTLPRSRQCQMPSMGPQHESCGKFEAARPRHFRLDPSMGPQHESCGKCAPGRKPAGRPRPSMGPQHESCGKPLAKWFEEGTKRLQWGRNMRVAERS